MLASLLLSLTDYSIIKRGLAMVGGANYAELLQDKLFWKSLRVTLYYTALEVPLGQAGSLALALLLHRRMRLRSLFRTAVYLPSVTPIVAASAIWLWFLQPRYGLMNGALALLGIEGPAWLASREWAVPGLALVSLWGIGGPRMIIYLAGLQGVPEELKEAARIDGAGAGRVFAAVTLPHLTPTIFFNLIVDIIGSFQQFAVAYLATDGGPDNSTLFYVLYLYRNAFNYFRMGYASALAWVMLLILLGFTVLQFRAARRWVYYGGG
jgi:multiple sugar transport system permease protein